MRGYSFTCPSGQLKHGRDKGKEQLGVTKWRHKSMVCVGLVLSFLLNSELELLVKSAWESYEVLSVCDSNY